MGGGGWGKDVTLPSGPLRLSKVELGALPGHLFQINLAPFGVEVNRMFIFHMRPLSFSFSPSNWTPPLPERSNNALNLAGCNARSKGAKEPHARSNRFSEKTSTQADSALLTRERGKGFSCAYVG